MSGGRKIDATHALERGVELDSMRVEYSETLATWNFPGQGTHGSYAVHRVDGLARTRFVYLSKKYGVRWIKQSHNDKRTTNSTSKVHKYLHRAACTPHSTLYSSKESLSLHKFQRLTSDAVYSQRGGKQGIRYKMYHGNLNEPTTPAWKKCTKESKLQAEHPFDQIK